jgi:hypothetical protein
MLLPLLHTAGASAQERFTIALLADCVLFHPVHGGQKEGRNCAENEALSCRTQEAHLSAGWTEAPGSCVPDLCICEIEAGQNI